MQASGLVAANCRTAPARYVPSCKRTVSGSNPLTGSRSECLSGDLRSSPEAKRGARTHAPSYDGLHSAPSRTWRRRDLLRCDQEQVRRCCLGRLRAGREAEQAQGHWPHQAGSQGQAQGSSRPFPSRVSVLLAILRHSQVSEKLASLAGSAWTRSPTRSARGSPDFALRSSSRNFLGKEDPLVPR